VANIHIDFMNALDLSGCQIEYDNVDGTRYKDGSIVRYRCHNEPIAVVSEFVEEEVTAQQSICADCLKTFQKFVDDVPGIRYSFIKAKLS
jgi:hypothetical protein